MSNYKATKLPHPTVVFFDGVCGLCNSTVDFLIKYDHSHQLRFAPLQGQTALKFLSSEQRDNLDSIVFATHQNFYFRSDAVLMALSTLGGAWRLSLILWVIPRGIRDLVYRWIAQNRYRWFGKSESCRIPTPQERSLFLN